MCLACQGANVTACCNADQDARAAVLAAILAQSNMTLCKIPGHVVLQCLIIFNLRSLGGSGANIDPVCGAAPAHSNLHLVKYLRLDTQCSTACLHLETKRTLTQFWELPLHTPTTQNAWTLGAPLAMLLFGCKTNFNQN